MQVRNGDDYRAGLQDGRCVLIDGEVVRDVVNHRAFKRAIASFAHLYDYQADPQNLDLMTFAPKTGGKRVNKSWLMPRSLDELVERRKAITAWSELSFGFLGRSPDHLATALTGMLMGVDVLARGGRERAKAFRDYVDHVRDNDLFVTYVIQNPQAGKSAGPAGQRNSPVLHVVSENDAGIIVKGAKMLGTSTVMSDEIFVGHIQPLQANESAYALSFAVPVAQPGVKLLSRRSYEAASLSVFDCPLSARFDENDAVVYFDDVFVPFERLFVYREPDIARAQWHDTPAHVYQNYQSQIRMSVKLRFLLGVARRVAEFNGATKIAQVRNILGQLAAKSCLVSGMVAGMEAEGRHFKGYFVPDASLLYAAQSLTQELYPQFVQSIRDLSGGSVIMLPASERDIANEETRRFIEATQVSPVAEPLDRVILMKLAWDAIGSEFGSRHVQYEMFYGGAQYVNHGHMWRTYDWESAAGLVDNALTGQ